MQGTVIIHLQRGGGETRRYEVPFEPGMNAIAAMKYIYEKLDRSVAYPLCLCRMGRCGACTMRVNGKVVLGCAARLAEGEEYTFGPANEKTAVQDLVYL